MRLLHTSDWHLGRTLCATDLASAHASALDQICRLVEAPADGIPIDAVLVAGDVFDRGVPAVESMELLEATLERLVRHTHVIVTSGNHDSARRLGFGSQLFRERLHFVTDVDLVDRPVVITGSDGVPVAVYAFPYLEPEHASARLAVDGVAPARSHEAIMTAAMERVRADLAERPATRAVVMAHAFVTGAAATTQSERSIAVGGIECVPVECFADIDYVALGHLHRPQRVPRTPPRTVAHYPGSLLRFSFDEQEHDKGILLVDLANEGPAVVTPVPIAQPRGMATLRGTLAELTTSARYAEHVTSWVRLIVTDDVRPERMIPQLRQRFPHALVFIHEPTNRVVDAPFATTKRSEEDARELGADFIAYVTSRSALPEEVALFQEAVERVRVREGA